MPEVATPPAAPAQDLGKTPTLLETLAGQMDISGAPVIQGRELPPIAQDDDGDGKNKSEKKEEKQEAKPEEKPEEKKTREEREAVEQAEWKKASEIVADKLFKKRGPPKKEEAGDKGKSAEAKVDDEKPPVKPDDKKPEKPEKPAAEKPGKRISEAEITERAAAAAAEAATRAVSKMAKSETVAPAKPPDPAASLSPAERRHFEVYQELESSQPDRYKGITTKYLKSLAEIQDYTKTWAKENPGQKFDPNAEEHNAFFERVEPEVDEDDWVDAKANLRARAISEQAVKPLNEKLQQMEKDRAKAMLEPFIHHKQLESVHMLFNEFDPEIAAELNKPEGARALAERDPITAGILNQTAGVLFTLAAETIRLHDLNVGIEFDARNPAHKEIADFILEQEQRISKLPAEDKARDGKRFIGRLAYRGLPQEDKAGYWFLDQDDIIYLLSQKYAKEAKKIRDAEVEKFNATAERLGYKKIDTTKPATKADDKKSAQQTKPKETVPSPEAVSKTSVKTAAGTDGKPAPSEGDVILGRLFQTVRST